MSKYLDLDGLTAGEPLARAELEVLRKDSARIDFLQRLTTRADYQNQRRPTVSVGSDMHLGGGICGLFMRDLLGNIVGAGYAESVRDAIDAAMGMKK